MARRRSNRDAKQDEQSGTQTIDISAAPRVAHALQLRRLGWTYARIGKTCGYANESGARKAIKKARAAIIHEEARELVAQQMDMLDEAFQVVLKRIIADDKESLWAVDRLAPLLKRQAELMGLDAQKDAPNAAQVLIRTYGAGTEAV